MRKLFLIVLLTTGFLSAEELPVWFDTFQAPLESQSGWQTFRAAYALEFGEDHSLAGDGFMKVKVKFTSQVREAILIWRFPDVQMKKFRLRVKLPKDAQDVFLRMVTNDTQGDAAFFKPWVDGNTTVELPLNTAEGKKVQKASPLPTDNWVTYEVTMPDDIFVEQKKQKSGHPVEDFALMNTGRDSLNLSAESRPATEAFFISFVVPEYSPLFGRELEFMVDSAEIY
ncbi:Rieske (2Fe-2S) protein [Tichowtungia aerotolerans]|uniref:Uncharacterized protein n=1 Tax=Tichowtungia aerotolerans TaxID=2697043 RepID=A0A6P1MH17_9BACT|nr:hypothetical protein [Tichowtungia aerotolerans]QHI70375.1 hypothetical protein GT409_13300 [Tichowtungia aerotolerans]